MKKTYLIFSNAKMLASSMNKKNSIQFCKSLDNGRWVHFDNNDKKNYPLRVVEVEYGSKFKEIFRINYLKQVK